MDSNLEKDHEAATEQNGWHTWSVEQNVSGNRKPGYQKRKIEVLAANYPLEIEADKKWCCCNGVNGTAMR